MRAKKSADFRLIFVNRGLRIPDKSNKQEETYAGTITCYTNIIGVACGESYPIGIY